MYGTVFDLEGDGLKPTKLHVMSASVDGKEVRSTNDYQDMRNLLLSQEVLVGHLISRFDIPESERLLEIEVPKETLIVDTLAVAWYLYPERGKERHTDGSRKNYGLDSFGKEIS